MVGVVRSGGEDVGRQDREGCGRRNVYGVSVGPARGWLSSLALHVIGFSACVSFLVRFSATHSRVRKGVLSMSAMELSPLQEFISSVFQGGSILGDP